MKRIIKISKILYLTFITLLLIFFVKQGIDKYNGVLIEGYGPALISLGGWVINSFFLIFFKFRNKLLQTEYVYIYLYEFYLFVGIIFSLKPLWIIIFIITVLLNFYIVFLKKTI
jgi:hypothetical protein